MNRTIQLANPLRLRFVAAASMMIISSLSAGCSSPQAKEAGYMRRGQALVEKKDYSRALLEFKNASLAMPRHAEPYYQMGLAYVTSGNLANAIACLRKAIELNPRHEQAQLKLAELMTTSNNKELLQQAAERLEGVLSASPDNPEATDALALAEWKLGKTTEATAKLEETLRKFPSRLQTSIALVRVKLAQKDLPAAEQILSQAVASAPESSAARSALGQLYMLANQPAKAEAEMRKAIQLDANNTSALMGLAAIQVAANRTDEAEQTYKQLAFLPGPQFKPLHALFLYRLGKRDAAVAELEKLAKEDPGDRTARSRLFAAYVALRKTQLAHNLVTDALKKNPKDTDALFERAGLYLRLGDAADAEKDLREVLRFKPDFAEGHVAMAQVYGAQNLTRTERSELNDALRINPGLLQARLMLARSFMRTNEAKAALEILNNTPPKQKGMPATIIERNWAWLAVGETKELRSVLDQALRIRRLPELVIQDGVLRMQQGDYSGARADAEEAIKNNPEDVRGARLLADAYSAQKQPAKAEERLKQLASEHPQSSQLANLLGQWYFSARNLPNARRAFEAAQTANPKFLGAALPLAEIDYQEKHQDAARQRLLALIAADPKNVPALLLLATWAGEAGDQTEAMQRYRSVLAIDWSNITALNNLAHVLATSDPDTALKYAQQAAELVPDNAAVQDTLGWIYYRKAIYATAVTYLETAVAKEPTPRRQFHLAMSYFKARKPDLGGKMLQLALQKDPKLAVREKGW